MCNHIKRRGLQKLKKQNIECKNIYEFFKVYGFFPLRFFLQIQK